MLGEYLRAACGTPWITGKHDCCTLAGDWAITWARGDPMAEWRGKYSTDQEALRLIVKAGGLLMLWQRALTSIGVATVGESRAGDVGVVRAFGEDGKVTHVGAIWTGQRWAFRASRGMNFEPAEPLCVWGPR